MTCSACSAGIERTLNKMQGVEKAEVSLMGESMVVEYDESSVSREQLVAAVRENSATERRRSTKRHGKRRSRRRILSKGASFFPSSFLCPLLYFSMGGMVGLPQPSAVVNHTVQLILTLAIIVVNFRFFTSGTKALVKRVPNMDTLVTLGSAAAFAYSLVQSRFCSMRERRITTATICSFTNRRL